MSYFNQKDLEDRIKDLEADLYETIPFRRSQAEQWDENPDVDYDAWEKEVESELAKVREVLAKVDGGEG